MKSAKWTREEDEVLIQGRLYLSSSYKTIANQLEGRTKDSVRHRWETIRDKVLSGRIEDIDTEAKILVFDIETSPLEVYTWGVYQQFIRPENVIRDWFVISWAAKWFQEPEILSGILTPKEARNSDDKRIVASLWKLFDEADIIVAHNGDRFDVKKINWRFLVHEFPPPMSYKTVDTLKVARKYFASTSNKLDYLTQQLNIGKKYETGGFDLWKRCVSGEQNALLEMLAYNIKDIQILEDTYLKLLPWITNHPNLGLFTEENEHICRVCGSSNIEQSDKRFVTATNSYYQYRCLNCNHVGRTKEKATTKEKRKVVLPS